MKRIIVTGISGGIGRAIVGDLLSAMDDKVDEAYSVVGVYHRNKPNIMHRHLALVQVNLQDDEQVAAFSSDFAPGIWGIVNLAGAQLGGMHWKTTPSDEANVVEANLLSTMNMCSYFSSALRRQGAGRIINVSSVVAGMGAVGCSAYAASKAAIEGYTRSIALELAKSRVTANCVALGYFNYGMIESIPDDQRARIQERIPLGRLGVATDVAALLLYLLGKHSAYMTGQTLHLNGGIHFG